MKPRDDILYKNGEWYNNCSQEGQVIKKRKEFEESKKKPEKVEEVLDELFDET